MAFSLGFFPNPTLNSRALPRPLVLPFSSVISTISSASPKNARHLKLRHLPRTSSEGKFRWLSLFSQFIIFLASISLSEWTCASLELDEDSKFVPLTAEDPQYGPPALLLLGFEVEEVEKIQQLLKDLDGEFLQVILCTEDMIPRSLWEAINTKQPNLEEVKIARSLPRICFLSGLSGEEMMMFIDAFPETGLEPAVFAALVPNSAHKPLQELIEEIMGDHEMLSSKNE
ncbi:hypothetical protein PanWU01x14_018440 [Parasponia andersonii]|uniref:Vacuolar acid trehalase n=1 Tax=Parasponia andersonii TaxID=3476 RepID=A0A2P5DZB7_PARAD|nr:hypothetical protein PanWU01x14_018440 [Parasponia andersonii]